MIDINTLAADLAWPCAFFLAWLAGEFGHRWTGLPRISIYGVVGFLLAAPQLGLLPPAPNQTLLLLANIAFGLILFELGYRINLRWLRANPWIGITGLTEAIGTFVAVYALAQWYGTTTTTALLLAALAMSTSPAGILRVINEERSAGQVTERVLHLSALNCVLAVFAFKVTVGFMVFQTSGSILQAAQNSLMVMLASATFGVLFGLAMPALLRALRHTTPDGTVAFAIAVICLVALTHTLKLSPLLATLTFGLVARHRRVALSQTQRSFGALGDFLSIVLFVFIAATLEWQNVMAGIGFGLALIAVRFIVKVAGISLYAHVSGISWQKGLLTGLAMTPISAFAILMLEQMRHIGINLVDQVSLLAAATLTLEILGPILTQRALIWAREVAHTRDS